MNIIVNIVSKALRETRHLTEKEIEVIISELIKYLEINKYVKNIEFDYYRKINSLAGFDPLNNTLYFNMALITEGVFNKYHSQKLDFTFNEYYLLQQLMVILHELKHVMQRKILLTNNESVIRDVIMDSDITLYDIDIYNRYYHLFPIEKDATIFSCNEMIRIVNLCQYFDEEIIKKMYNNLFNCLLVGYQLPGNCDGTLQEFYKQVLDDYSRFLQLQDKAINLNTYDKMSFNFNINGSDLRNLYLAQKLIIQGFNPEIVLLKENKGRGLRK